MQSDFMVNKPVPKELNLRKKGLCNTTAPFTCTRVIMNCSGDIS